MIHNLLKKKVGGISESDSSSANTRNAIGCVVSICLISLLLLIFSQFEGLFDSFKLWSLTLSLPSQSAIKNIIPQDIYLLKGQIPALIGKNGKKIIESNKGQSAVYTFYSPGSADGFLSDEKSTDGRKPIKEMDISAKQLNASGEDIRINNETSYDIDVSDMLKRMPDIQKSKNGVTILILHTHATESYTSEKELYTTEDERTEDCDKNVVRVGRELRKTLEEQGFSVIHDETLHDKQAFYESYKRALNTIEVHLKQNPEIGVVIDLHRDSITRTDYAISPVIEIEGKKAAQIMLVMGTDKNGLSHSKWKENLRLGILLQKQLNSDYPGLARQLNLRKERFNQHATTGSMLIEVGASANTLEEAVYSANLIGKSLGTVLKSLL